MRYKKIGKNAAANAFGQVVTIGVQLLAIPIFLLHWDLEKYGRWVMISLVPAFISLTDFGLVGAMSNIVATQRAQGRKKDSIKTFLHGRYLLNWLALIIVLLSASAGVILFAIDVLDRGEAIAFVVLSLNGVIAIRCYLFEVILRAEDRSSEGIFLINLVRLIEWTAIAFSVSVNADMPAVAASMFCARAVSQLSVNFLLKYSFPEYYPGGIEISRGVIESLIRPSASYLLFPVGNVLATQGVILVTGFFLGPAAAAVISAYRTYSRVTVQGLTLICHSFWPEITVEWAKKRRVEFKKLQNKMMTICLVFVAFSVASLITAAEWFMYFWAHGKIPFDYGLTWLFCLATFPLAYWMPRRVTLMATTNHEGIAIDYFVASFFTLLVLACVLMIWPKVLAVPIILMASELFMCYKCRLRAKILELRDW